MLQNYVFVISFDVCILSRQSVVIQHKPTKCEIAKMNVYFLMSPTCFELRGFILRETVLYAVWLVLHTHYPAHQIAHTDACKSYHATYTITFKYIIT